MSRKTGRQLGIIFILLSVLWTAFIFFNSSKNAVQSSADSGKIVEVVEKIASSTGMDITPDRHERIAHYVRKAAHFTEFAILGILTYITVILFINNIIKSLLVIIFPLVIAIADELSQFASEGRSPQLTDMLIDLGGAVAGVMLIFAVIWLLDRRKRVNV